MRKAQILEKIETVDVMIRCPECEDNHMLHIVKDKNKQDTVFDVTCIGCDTQFIVDTNDEV